MKAYKPNETNRYKVGKCAKHVFEVKSFCYNFMGGFCLTQLSK